MTDTNVVAIDHRAKVARRMQERLAESRDKLLAHYRLFLEEQTAAIIEAVLAGAEIDLVETLARAGADTFCDELAAQRTALERAMRRLCGAPEGRA